METARSEITETDTIQNNNNSSKRKASVKKEKKGRKRRKITETVTQDLTEDSSSTRTKVYEEPDLLEKDNQQEDKASDKQEEQQEPTTTLTTTSATTSTTPPTKMQSVEEYKLRRLEREQQRDRERAAIEAREREWERERQRERETNRKILLEREKERERLKNLEKLAHDKAQGMHHPSKQGKERQDKMDEDEEEDDDDGFFIAASEESKQILPALHNALSAVEQMMHVSPVASYLSSMTRDLINLQTYCLFTMAHPGRPLSWKMGYFSAIPTEIQSHVLSFTEFSDLWRIRSVCKVWNAIVERESYWVTLLERHFSPIRNRLHSTSRFGKNSQWLFRSKTKKLCVRDHIVGEWIGKYWNKTTLSLWEGEWKDGRILGYGSKFIPASAEFYEGMWKDEKLCGYGRADTRVLHYQGDFKENLKHGRGTCVWKTSDAGYAKYEGEWQYDLMDGYGTMRYLNGDVYVGEWLDGMKDGLGSFTEGAGGKEYRGIWERDICQVTFDDQGEVVFIKEEADNNNNTTPSSRV